MPVFRQDRLYSALLNTGLQIKDNPLYQVIYQLIGAVNEIANTLGATGSSGGSGGGTTINNITNIFQQLGLDGGADAGDDSLIPGPQGIDGANGMVPYFIASNEVFHVPEFKQALFAMNIDNEGIMIIDGFLIEVDGLPGTPQTYNEINVVTDRAYDANATTLDEIADVLGTVINDLRNRGIVN
mgnify:CR=1 FL=1